VTTPDLRSENTALAACPLLERVTGIEPALSAWESVPSGPVTWPDLRVSVSASDRERPLFTGVNGPLMARPSWSDLGVTCTDRHALLLPPPRSLLPLLPCMRPARAASSVRSGYGSAGSTDRLGAATTRANTTRGSHRGLSGHFSKYAGPRGFPVLGRARTAEVLLSRTSTSMTRLCVKPVRRDSSAARRAPSSASSSRTILASFSLPEMLADMRRVSGLRSISGMYGKP
jgi:hypothetical protein